MSFDQFYADYKEKLVKNKKPGKKDFKKLNNISIGWSKRISKSFPLLNELIEMVKDQLITLTTVELSDLPAIKRFMYRWRTDEPYLKGLISRCEKVSKRFEEEFFELKEKLPEDIPEEPNSP